MANLYPPPHPTAIGFGPNTVPHTPASLGFGFGLGGAGSVPAHNSPRHFSPHPSMSMAAPTGGNSPLRQSQKRRHEPEDEEEDDDDQPTTRNPMHFASDRPRRTLAKRLRVTPTDSAESSKNGQKDGKNKDNSERDIDVGVLLASIPTQSLLPLLTSLLAAQPNLRPLLLSLIPRPSLETSLKALAESAKKLRDAYPYSSQQPSTSFGFGAAPSTSFGFGAAPAPSSSFGSGFGSANRPAGGFGFGFGVQPSRASPTPPSVGGMRDNYILSRVRPAIQEYHTTAQSYLPYFSLAPTASNALPTLGNQPTTHGPSAFQQQRPNQGASLQKPHPTETFSFLVALTQHISSFPPLITQPQSNSNGSGSTLLTDHLIPRLLQEWSAWVDYIDNYVNRESGMFSEEVVRGWCRSLDEFAGDGSSYLNHTFGFNPPTHNQCNNGNPVPGMKEIRDKWVARVGWLIGRVPPPPGFATGGVPIEMEEEEEL